MIDFSWLTQNERIIHSIKTACAVLICYVLIKTIHFHIDQWLIITVLVVMCGQLNVGGLLQKSYLRFLGTSVGSLIAMTVLIFFGANSIAIAIAITFSSMLFSFIATSEKVYSDAGTLGAVTVVIILINPHPTLIIATERFLEISVGILIAALISQFILPIHARSHLRKQQTKTIRLLCDYYSAMFLINYDAQIIKKKSALIEDAIVKVFIAQRKLAKEAAQEPLGKAYKVGFLKKSLSYEKEILYSITFMYRSYHASSTIYKILAGTEAVKNFNQTIYETLSSISNILETNSYPADFSIPDLEPLKQAIYSVNKTLSLEEKVYTDGFLFCAQLLVARLYTLLILIKEMNSIKK